MLFRLWPLFVVAIGLDLVLGKRSILFGLLGAVTVLILGVGIWSLTAPRMASGTTAVGGEQISQPIGAAERARLKLNPAAADFELGALRDSQMLISGRIRPSAMTGTASVTSRRAQISRSGPRPMATIWLPQAVRGRSVGRSCQ